MATHDEPRTFATFALESQAIRDFAALAQSPTSALSAHLQQSMRGLESTMEQFRRQVEVDTSAQEAFRRLADHSAFSADQLMKNHSAFNIASDLTKQWSAASVASDINKHLTAMDATHDLFKQIRAAGSQFNDQMESVKRSIAQDTVRFREAFKFVASPFPKLVDEAIGDSYGFRKFVEESYLQREKLQDFVKGIDLGIPAEALEVLRTRADEVDDIAKPTASAGLSDKFSEEAVTRSVNTAGESAAFLQTPEEWYKTLPPQAKWLLWFVFLLLTCRPDNFYFENRDRWLAAHHEVDRKAIQSEVASTSGPENARRLRCTNTRSLNIRSDPERTGKIITTLSRGTPIEVIESRGSWSLIAFRDARTSDTREGWAASGYLSLTVC